MSRKSLPLAAFVATGAVLAIGLWASGYPILASVAAIWVLAVLLLSYPI